LIGDDDDNGDDDDDDDDMMMVVMIMMMMMIKLHLQLPTSLSTAIYSTCKTFSLPPTHFLTSIRTWKITSKMTNREK